MAEVRAAPAIGPRNHHPGGPHRAERVDRQALRPGAETDGAGAQNDLGIARARQGRLDEAAAHLQRALRLQPDYPDAHNNLGIIREKQGRLDEATAGYEQALRLKPDYAEAHYNLSIVLARLDRLDEAVVSYQQALRLKPNYTEAHNNLGTVLARQGRLDEAAASYREALRLQPDGADAHNNLGLVLVRQGRRDEAVASLQQALRLQPDYPEAHANLGNALQDQDRLDEAVASYERALCLQPDAAGVQLNLGNVLARQDRLEEAMASFQQAIRLSPDDALAHHKLGLALWRQGRLEEAVAAYEQALRLRPDYPEAHWDRSLAWILLGRLAEGWPGFEWRWKCKDLARTPPFPTPPWDGAPLEGRTILVHAEQGLGDTLHFVRYLPLVRRRGGRVILLSQPPLLRLLSRLPGIDRLMAWGEPLPEYDVHVPLLSLPGLFGTTLDSVPAEVPYLDAEPALVESWRDRLGAYPGFKVGIAWQGNPQFPFDRIRSVPLAEFAPLARVPGVHLFCLQKGVGRDQLPALKGYFPVIDLGRQLDETTGPFLDTAAVMKNLDLVITSDTAAAHLAGALGVPVWVALNEVPDWRWLLEREDSPWYPTMRLFRQSRPAQWEEVFERITEALLQRVAAPADLRPITVEIAPGELIDKITILELKSERITEAAKRHHVGTELALLVAARDRAVPGSAELAQLAAELKAVNEALWEIEDAIRRCERDADFGPRFVALARSVYGTNDRRAALKRQINEQLGSRLIEEKSYASWAREGRNRCQ
jgi:tetratricopeptide (TPR) repeat protein